MDASSMNNHMLMFPPSPSIHQLVIDLRQSQERLQHLTGREHTTEKHIYQALEQQLLEAKQRSRYVAMWYTQELYVMKQQPVPMLSASAAVFVPSTEPPVAQVEPETNDKENRQPSHGA